MWMPDTNTKDLDNTKQNWVHKKHSFFWWEINAKTKDLLDFRYNTQEEIDKLDDEIATANDLDENIKQSDEIEDTEDIDNDNGNDLNQDEDEFDLEDNLKSINESDSEDDDFKDEYNEPIEWEIVENANNENDVKDNQDDENAELWDSVKFFDPFELDGEYNENSTKEETEKFNPFGLSEENDDNNDEEDEENDDDSDEEDKENNEENDDDNDEEDEEKNEENDDSDEEDNEEDNEEYEEEDDDEEDDEQKKIKINHQNTTTNKKNQLAEWEDTINTEEEEEYKPSAEEIFEREPQFFADDELSQQFMRLVLNVRGIFKLERKDNEQNPYFKIIWWKNEDSTIEYLFYLIEEEDEPIDLYIKKVEINQEEDEHLVQFSYNEDKELNIFVDEIILYEKINKSNPESIEYNDTRTILEKFIFLTDNQYDKLKSELDKIQEEKHKRKQLQQIFKGF